MNMLWEIKTRSWSGTNVYSILSERKWKHKQLLSIQVHIDQVYVPSYSIFGPAVYRKTLFFCAPLISANRKVLQINLQKFPFVIWQFESFDAPNEKFIHMVAYLLCLHGGLFTFFAQ